MTRAENVNRCPDSAPVELCRDAELAGALRLVTVPVRDDQLGIAAIDSIAAWALRPLENAGARDGPELDLAIDLR